MVRIAHKTACGGLAVLIALAPACCPARADAPTHRLAIATESGQTFCSFRSSLTNVGYGASPPLQVNLWYRTKANDAGESAVALSFPALPVGGSRTSTDEATGYRCGDVQVTRIEVVCPGASADDRCPGYVNVAIPSVSEPSIKARSVEGK